MTNSIGYGFGQLKITLNSYEILVKITFWKHSFLIHIVRIGVSNAVGNCDVCRCSYINLPVEWKRFTMGALTLRTKLQFKIK